VNPRPSAPLRSDGAILFGATFVRRANSLPSPLTGEGQGGGEEIWLGVENPVPPPLHVKDLKTYYFGFRGTRVVKAVDGVSFSLEAGETFGLVGSPAAARPPPPSPFSPPRSPPPASSRSKGATW
jgi:hypothetical protein